MSYDRVMGFRNTCIHELLGRRWGIMNNRLGWGRETNDTRDTELQSYTLLINKSIENRDQQDVRRIER